MSGNSSNFGPAHNNANPYDYGDKKSNFGKIPKFNGDLKNFLGGKPTSTAMSWI
jgi:hypothetical protein